MHRLGVSLVGREEMLSGEKIVSESQQFFFLVVSFIIWVVKSAGL